MTTRQRDIMRMCLLAGLVLALLCCHALADTDPADTAVSAVNDLRDQRDQMRNDRDACLADLQSTQEQVNQISGQIQAVTSDLQALYGALDVSDQGAALARIADLLASTPPQEPTPATTITPNPGNPIAYKTGDGTSCRFDLDGVLVAGQKVLLSAYNKVSQEVVGDWTHTLATEPIEVPPAKLDELPEGQTVITAQLIGTTSGGKANWLIDIVRQTDHGDDGTRQDVAAFSPVAGQTYRNLRIHGAIAVTWKTINDVHWINCDFRDATVLLTVQAQDDGSGACSGWTFDNCTFVGATRSDWGHSQGVFLKGVKGFIFRKCVFDRNGWIGTQRFNQNHDVYLDARRDADHPTWAINENILFEDCTFSNAAAQGCKMRGFIGLTFRRCNFEGNLIDLANDTRSPGSGLVIEDCTFRGTGGTDSINLTYAWSIHLKSPADEPLSDAQILRCKWVGPALGIGAGVSPGWSGSNAITLQGAGVLNVLVDSADWSAWTGEKRIKNEIGERLRVVAP